MRSTLIARIVTVGIILGASASSALAQPDETLRRPFRRLFGATVDPANRPEGLDLTVTLYEAYDDNILGEELPGGDPRVGTGGAYPGGSVDMTYTHRGRRVSLTTLAGTAAQYYPQLDDQVDRSHNLGIDVGFEMGRRAQLRLSQTASFATYYALLGLPGSTITGPGPVAPGADLLNPNLAFGVSPEGGWSYHSLALLTRQLGRRASFEGRYGVAHTDLTDHRATYQEIGGAYVRTMTRQAALRAGYGYEGRVGTGSEGAPVFHHLDLGIDYRRALSRARNTFLSVSTGSGMVVAADASREFRFLADARLLHLMRRSWSTSIGYHRGLEFLGTLSQLVATDAVEATLNGFVNHRLETTISGSYSLGHLGSSSGPPLRTYSGVARLQYGLTRWMALDGRYHYYYYKFSEEDTAPVGVVPTLSRNGVLVGLTFQVVR